MTAVARATDPETSHEAAASVGDVRESQRFVHSLLKASGGATDEALVNTTQNLGFPISPSGLRTRRSELVRLGLVEDSGERERLASGRRAIVWRVRR
ncbi:hypothetical protein [Terracoccus sp. 273MFTsu3.1]|uniref:hypothetical protein n=1 Tax=Terracoccus sp. 273MFTsu3.1 TaxID=1172188 RepID=UPI0003A0E45F|nr:hypothetical protein [Terracoccus sp. 273MFTsu3.1]